MTLPGFPPAGDGQRRPPASAPSYDDHDRRRTEPQPTRHDPRSDNHRPDGDRPTGSDEPAKAGVRIMNATRDFTRKTVRKVDDISRADGAEKSGLRTLIWSNCLSMSADALVSVYLATTLFFAAPGEQQRSNVALYLLVTVAPFAVIAPIIGPLLDRIDRGRRAALAATFGVRAVLCYLLAVHTDSTVLLYICALLCLVFSRAYTVLRAAVIPRVLPDDMQLVTANSRMNIFGMIGAGVIGAVGAGLISLFNSIQPGNSENPTLGFTIALIACALVCLAGAWVSMQLPRNVDTDEGEGKVSMSARNGIDEKDAPAGVRIVLGTHVVTALRSSSVQRFLGGFLTFFMVFYIQSTLVGFGALAALGALGAAAGVGSVVGTAIGTRLADRSPDAIGLVVTGIAVGCCILAAITPGVIISIVVALIAAVASALGKIALDAIIQREVPDTFRSSAFSRSETMLQLAWVGGGTLGILLPTSAGTLWVGWTVATVILTIAFGLVLYGRQKAHQAGPQEAAIKPRDPNERRFPIATTRTLRRRRSGDTGTNADPGAPQQSPAPQQPGAPYAGPTYAGSQYPMSPGSSAAGQSSNDDWLSAPAPTYQQTNKLPDFRAAGLRPPPENPPPPDHSPPSGPRQ